MITVVLDTTKSLDDSDIYTPLLYRSMRHEKCFYIKSKETSKVNKIKSIIKYYPKNDYEIIVLLDLSQMGESLIEKIYLINSGILSEIFADVKRAVKVRYIVLDYINSNYMKEEYEFLKNIENIQTTEVLADYLNRIIEAPNKVTWPNAMAKVEFFNVKDLFIERVLPFTEVDIITLNKSPKEEKEDFFRKIYLKIYGFIDLIAEDVIVEDLTTCCYKELPIYNLNIELNEDAIEETAKRYLLNLENEEKKLDLSSFEKIEYTSLFEENENEEKEYQKIINEINQTKLNLKVPKVTLFNNDKDLKTLNRYIDIAQKEYKTKTKTLKLMYGSECKNVRDDLNKGFDNVKHEVKERFEVENKIKEEQAKIQELKYKKSKPIMENREQYRKYEEYLGEQKTILEQIIKKRQIVSESFWFQLIFSIIYIFIVFILMRNIYTEKKDLYIGMKNIIIIISCIWIVALIVVSSVHKLKIKNEYKNTSKKLEYLFLKITENQRNGTESIQLARQLIKSQKTIKHLQDMLNKTNEKVEKVGLHKYKIQDYKNFCKLINRDITLDGSVNISDLDSTYEIDINKKECYKNKTYSFLDYIIFNKHQLCFKNANTSRVVKKENAETYITYVSIE